MVHRISPMQLNSGSYTDPQNTGKIKHLEAWMEKRPIMMGDQKQSPELHQYRKIPHLE